MRIGNSKKLCLVLMAALMLLLLAACGQGSNQTPAPADSGTSGSSGSSGSAGTPDATPAQAASTIIKVGVSGTPDLDPAVGTTGSSVRAIVNLYDSLVFPSKENPVEPRVAESWDVSSDGLTYTFKIKEGIKFHNGSEMKASDVAFSMNRMLAIGEGYAYLYADFVDSAEAISDYEVVFHMKKAYGPFISSLVRMYIVSEQQVMDNIKADGPYGEFGDYGKAYLAYNDAGSGAYMFKDLVQQDYFEAVKFDDWFMGWDSNPNAPSGFKQMAIPEAATVRTMVNTGELDITDQWQSNENLDAMSKMDGISIGKLSTSLIQNMYLNNKKAPLDDINFRRAIACLVDYNTLIQQIYIDSVVATSPVASGVAGYVPTYDYSYNLDKAKEYIAASKYANNYQDYVIEFCAISDVADAEKVGLIVQASAAQIGVNVEVTKSPWVSVVDSMGSIETSPHLISINSAPAYNEAGTYLESRYHSKTTGTWEQGEWLQSNELDAMIEDSLGTIDEAERLAKYRNIQHYITDEIFPSVYLCELAERFAYRSGTIYWPSIDDVPEGEVGSALYGYHHIYATFEVYPEGR